jgi:hypothetical protein
MNHTTRRFPRTVDQAFHHGAEYGCAITHYRNHLSRLTTWIMLCGLAGLVVMAVVL